MERQVTGMDEENRKNEQAKKATLIVRILYRQNTTWQGEVTWTERDTTKQFRSALELIRLIDSTEESDRACWTDSADGRKREETNREDPERDRT